jgi:hypothetical protein
MVFWLLAMLTVLAALAVVFAIVFEPTLAVGSLQRRDTVQVSVAQVVPTQTGRNHETVCLSSANLGLSWHRDSLISRISWGV